MEQYITLIGIWIIGWVALTTMNSCAIFDKDLDRSTGLPKSSLLKRILICVLPAIFMIFAWPIALGAYWFTALEKRR